MTVTPTQNITFLDSDADVREGNTILFLVFPEIRTIRGTKFGALQGLSLSSRRRILRLERYMDFLEERAACSAVQRPTVRTTLLLAE